MRVNVYSQELTPEVIAVSKTSNTGIVYDAAQLVLHSSPMLHHPPADDDRSAITFWMPSSPERREQLALAFERIAVLFRARKDEPTAPAIPKREPIPDYADVIALADWLEIVKCGGCTPDDGSGSFAADGLEDPSTDCFTEPPAWATHVAWYNK